MKKIVLVVVLASFVVSCKKIQAGSNKGVIKLEEGVERYSDIEIGSNEGGHATAATHGTEGAAAKSNVAIDLNGVALQGYKGGLEDSMISFLKSDGYKNAADDAALKDRWYNFDKVNFKMGSANQLEAGSAEQLQNLAAILKAYPDAKIKIGGYTDRTGDEAANVKLSQDRANFIKAELGKAGVGAQVLGAEGYGSKFATVAKEASDAERAVDRKMSVRFAK